MFILGFLSGMGAMAVAAFVLYIRTMKDLANTL